MGLSFEKFSFTKITTVASQTVNLAQAFTPKVVFLWTDGASGTAFEEHVRTCFGFSDGVNDACVSSQTADNAGTPLYKNICRNDGIVFIYDDAAAVSARADVTSFGSGTITLNWSVNAAGNQASIIHGIAIGGTDITNAKVIFPTNTRTTAGTESYTGAGFQPTFMMQLGLWNGYNSASTASNNVAIGTAISTSKRWALCINTEGNATASDTWAYHRNDECSVCLSNTGALQYEADFVSFDSDGYTVNYSLGDSAAPGDALPTLLIQGGQWDVGTLTQRDNTGAQAITTAGIGVIKGAFFATHGLVISTSGTPQAHRRLSIGGADGTRQGYTSHHDTDAAATSIVTKVQNTNGILRVITAAATATSSTTQAAADFTSFATNTININWSTADTTDRVVSWFAVGEAAAGQQFNRSPTAETVTISEASLTRVRSLARAPATESPTVSEASLTRTTQAFRAPSLETITIGESVDGFKVVPGNQFNRSPAIETITLAETIDTTLTPTVAGGATRFYLHNTTDATSGLPTTEQSSRTDSSGGVGISLATNNVMNTTKGTGTTHTTRVSSFLLSSVAEYYWGRWVSPALSGITSISANTWTWNFAASTIFTGASFPCTGNNQVLKVNCYVWRTSNSSKVGTILDSNTASVYDEPSTGSVYKVMHGTFSGSAVASVQNGDRIVFEYWTAGPANSSGYGIAYDGDTENITENATVTRHASFLETPQDLTGGGGSGAKQFNRVPFVELVTTSESITPLKTAGGQSFQRTPTAENTAVADSSLTRILSSVRVPSSDSVTVSAGTSTRMLSATRLPSTDTTTITESSLTRSRSLARIPTADSTTVTDSSLTRILSSVRVPSTEVVTTGESLSRVRGLVRIPSSDSVTVTAGTATRGISLIRVPSTDSTTITDSSLTRLLSLARAPSPESPTITEQLTRMLSAIRVPSSDSVTAQDSSTTQMITRVRAPSTDGITVSDISITRLLQLVRNPSDSVIVADSSLTRLLQLFRVPSSDTVTVGESLSGGKLYTRAPNAESINIIDASLTRIKSALRVPNTETVTVLDSSLSRMLQAFRVPSSDSITVNEQVTGGKVYTRIPSTDSVNITDSSLTRVLSLVRVPSSETVTPSDFSLTRIYSALRVPSQDSITTSENVTGQKLVGAQQYNRAPTPESITVSESSLTRLLSLVRVPTAEIVSIVESSLTRLLQLFRSPVSDSVTVVESSLTRMKSMLRAPTTDSVTVADSSLTRLLSALRLPSSETITTGENLIRVLSAIRSPSTEVITTGESVSRIHTTAGQFNRSPVTEVVSVSENLSRLLQLQRVPTAETVNLNEQLSRIITRIRVPPIDSISVSDGSLQRSVTRVRPLSDTPAVVEASLTRLLSAARSLSDTTVVSEVQSQLSLSRRLEETISVTEPVISRIVTAIRQVIDTVDIDEQVFFQTFHRFVFDSVVVAEQLFSERQALSGPVTYAIPSEVRPLLGNIGNQRTDAQIELAIDSAYDEINRRTGRQPPNEWKDTENDFGIVKKIARFKAALEMAVGIKDYEDREWMQKEIEEMFKIIEEGEGESGTTSTDIVGSSPDTTFALNPQGIIWSIRYPNLKKSSSSGENDTTVNPAT